MKSTREKIIELWTEKKLNKSKEESLKILSFEMYGKKISKNDISIY
jgi:hypothetical protein